MNFFDDEGQGQSNLDSLLFGAPSKVKSKRQEVDYGEYLTDEEQNVTPQNSLDSLLGLQTTPQAEEEKGWLGKTLEAIGKPGGALAGAIQYGLGVENPGEDLWDATKRGWDKNVSNTDTIKRINPEFAREHPYMTTALGIGGDIIADPLWVVAPAKIIKTAAGVSKAVGLTDIAAHAGNALANTKVGQKAVELGTILDAPMPLMKDITVRRAFSAINPLESELDKSARIKAELGEELNMLTKRIEDYKATLPEAQAKLFGESVTDFVEALPDVGKFALPAGKVAEYKNIARELQDNLTKAQVSYDAAKAGFGGLDSTAKSLDNLLGTHKIQPHMLPQVLDNIGKEAAPVAPKMGSIDPLGNQKAAAIRLAVQGKLSPETLLQSRHLFTPEELQGIVKQMRPKYRENAALDEIEQGLIRQAAGNPLPSSMLEREAIGGLNADTGVKLNSDIAANPTANITKQLPNLYQETKPILDGNNVLPKINPNVVRKLAEKGIDVSKLTQKDLDLLNSINPKDVNNIVGNILKSREIDKLNRGVQSAEKALNSFDTVSTKTRSEVLKAAVDNGLTPEQGHKLFEIGEEAASVMDKLTTELVKRGVLGIETAGKFYGGRHIRHMFSTHMTPNELYQSLLAEGKPSEAKKFIDEISKLETQARAAGHKLNLKDITPRKNMPPEIQQKLGRIYDATVPLQKGGEKSIRLIAQYDFLKDVDTKFAKSVPDVGYRQIPTTEHMGKAMYGPLAGKYVPNDIYNEVIYTLKQQDDIPGFWRKAVSWWKAGKTIFNPATWARNNMSNVMLLDMAGIPAQQVPKALVDGLMEYRNKGQYYQEARKNANFMLSTFAKNEVNGILEKNLNPSMLGKVGNKIKGVTKKVADGYQTNEVIGKMAAYTWARKQGKSIDEAIKFADKALFDYGKVPPVIDYLRKTGIVPFASFPYFATKASGRALYENPMKVLKYYKPMSATQNEDEKALMPDYLKPETLMPLGRGEKQVDGKGIPTKNYLDVSSIYPFQSGETVSLNPAFDAIAALKTNKDQLGRDIVRKGMTDGQKAAAVGDYGWKMLTPSLTPGNYAWDKLVNQGIFGESDYKGRQFGLPEAAAHTLFGLRNVPINLDESYESQKQNLKREKAAVTSEMKRTAGDRTLSKEEKRERLKEYFEHKKLLETEEKKLEAAYKRMKKEGR